MAVESVELLLVEDNEDDIVLIQEAFAESKLANVTNVVRHGQEALAYLRREGEYKDARRPALILLDINIPKKNGFEVLQELKRDPTLRPIPVVMMTASDREEDVVKSYSEGACSYVRKPVDFERLREVARHFDVYWTMVSRIPGRMS
jgi:CheY-like chemotaxis protein